MIITITFKTPDAVEYALGEFPEDVTEEAKKKLEKWIRYGEFVTIEFDLEKMTATVK